MKLDTYGFELSYHAINRLYERHAPLFAKPYVGKERRDVAYRVLNYSVEVKSIKNDTAFMAYIHEKYGYADHRFFVNGDVLFVGKVDGMVSVIMTTMSCSRHHLKTRLQKTGLNCKKQPA